MISDKYGWVIYTKQSLKNKFGNNAFEWMKSAAKNNGLEVDIIFEEDLNIEILDSKISYKHKNTLLRKPAFIHLRSYCFELAKSLQSFDIKLINKIEPLITARNKWLTHLALAKANIPQPISLLLRIEEAQFNEIKESINAPFIVKEIQGSKGEQVYLIHNKEELDTLKTKLNGAIICQEYIGESKGKDIRIHVIGGKTVVGIKRFSESDFRSNYNLGGSAEHYMLSAVEKNIAIKAAFAVGLEIAGVDILLSKRGPLVCEVNGIPAFRTVAKYSDVDIPDAIFKYIGGMKG